MTLFEYAAIFRGIMVALAVENVASSFHKLLEARGRVRWHWMAPTNAITLAVATLGMFWIYWVTRNTPVSNPTFLSFLPGALNLFLLYLVTAATLPDTVPDTGLDLKEFYFSTRQQLWSLFVASVLVEVSVGVWATARFNFAANVVRFSAPLYLGDLALGALAASMIFVRASWWHSVGIIVLTLGVFVLMGSMAL